VIDQTDSSDRRHWEAAAAWLAAAQDSQSDGGFSGRYKLMTGWTSSYPETTGYIVPTLLALEQETGDRRWHERAGRAIDFLLAVQLPSGAFPGGEVAENRIEPSPFNSAQILHGLTVWYLATKDQRVLDAAHRACTWLLQVQDRDGAFRRHFYLDQPATYSAYLSCWIAAFGAATGDVNALSGAGMHLDWTLQHRDAKSHWIDLAGFTHEQHKARTAYTHTIAYTLAGILTTSRILGRLDGIEAVRLAADAIMQRMELSNRLPSVLNASWQSAEDGQCLTGNSQMALIWFELYEMEGDIRFLNAGHKALNLVKAAQDLDNPNTGLRGGIGGSDPIWGSYIRNALPNWAAKYFLDAMLTKDKLQQKLA